MDASDWDERYSATDLVWSAEPNRFVVDQTSDLRPGAVLDLACGEGRNAIWLAASGWRATGIDFSAVAIEKAIALAARQQVNVSWLQGDVLALTPVPVWDLVLLAYIQLPERERRAVVELAGRATRPGGSVLVIAHDVRNLDQGVGGPKDRSVLWSPYEVRLMGFHDVRRETAIRPTADGDSLDTVVHLVRD